MNFIEEFLIGQPGRVRRIFELGGIAFNGRHSGQEYRVLCPFHDDHTPSMDVNLDKAVFICRACDARGDAVQFHARRNGLSNEAAIADLRDVLGPNGGRPEAARPSVVSRKRYEIRSADGTLVAIHERRDLSDGSKTFIWERDGKPGLGGLPLADLPLYGSERLGKAEPDAPMIVVEGEKASDALTERGYLAVATVTGAAATPGPKALKILRGHEVALWPDNDSPGRAHMGRIAAALQGAASTVLILKWGEREKDDAADFFARGGTTEQLDQMFADAPPWREEAGETEGNQERGGIRPDEEPPGGRTQPPSADWPALDPAALHGLAGDVVRTIDPHTEADPIGVLVHFLTMFGNAVGPTPHVRVEAMNHGANIFAVLVRRTSRGRKGTSEGQARRILSDADPTWARDQIVHGLSSGEGLIDLVRDLSKEEEEAGTAPRDRRVLVIEPEFAGTLRVMRRDGNALSAVIRQLWDTGNLRTLTRRNPLRATGAHGSIIGHATGTELLRYMEDETENGFANRFLWFRVRRSKLLPEGGSLTDACLAPLYARTEKALETARLIYEVKRSPEAAVLWRKRYELLSAEHPGLFGVVTSRAEAQVTRLSLLYALLDGSKEIREEHLSAALALWDYSAASARHIFGDLLGDPIADRILRELRAILPEGLTRTGITSDLFGRNVSAATLERALLTLKSLRLAFEVREEAGSQGGRPIERWFAR